MSRQYSEILISYIKERIFRVKFEDEYSEIKQTRAKVPQKSVLGPIIYLLYTNYRWNCVTYIVTDTAVLAKGNGFKEAANKI